MKTKFLFSLALLLAVMQEVWSQDALGSVPKKVYARDARITNIGVVASDIMVWKTENAQTQQSDTTVTSESYILWQSDGDLEVQAAQHRAQAAAIESQHRAKAMANSGSRRVSAISQEGRLQEWLAYFYYYVFTYEYPSVDADGKEVMLSAIAACPPKDADEVRDVIIGTHITITADKQRPSAQTNNYKADDWGVLMSMAAGKKLKLGWRANLTLGILLPFWPFWAGVGIAAEVKSGEDAYNNNLVILPDYEGYGVTKSRAHPYLYQELTARQVVDATRYGIALYKSDASLSSIRHTIRDDFRTVSCGYSQGGSVALATHRFIEQNGLSDELHFVGSLCGDGPYDPMATLMYYMKNDLAGKSMSMPVVLPLIVKGMLDSNPFMIDHRAEEYFNKKFLNTGIMNWLASKEYTTGDIEDKFEKCYKEGWGTDKTYFQDLFTLDSRKSPHLMMNKIMNEECYAYFRKVYEDNQSTFTEKGGIPLPTKRGVMEDLHLALASNDMTKGWTPEHTVMLFHSDHDTVVPYENAKSAQNSFDGWVVLNTSTNGHDHMDSGMDFFKGEESDVLKNFAIRIYMAKKKLCEQSWKNQQKGCITSW